MTKSTLCKLLAGMGVSLLLFTSCVKDTNLDMPAIPNQSFTEEFDTTSAALQRGWKFVNTSTPKGSNVWQQGGEIIPWFPAYSNNGSNAGFVGADYTSTSAAAGEISNWAVSPLVTMQNGDTIIFYTRAYRVAVLDASGAPTGDSSDYGNRLQVRINTIDEGYSTGSGDNAGNFTTSLLDINPTYLSNDYLIATPLATPNRNAYPNNWTRFEAHIYGLEKPVKGRFAFRYFVQGGGSNGLGSGVAVDHVMYKSVRN